MTRKILLIMALWLGIFSQVLADTTENPDPEAIPLEIKKEIVDTLSSRYYDWDEISMSGKLSSPLLPVSASVKIYMVRDSLAVISLSAPLVGEAARVEIDRDMIIAVNKLNGKYTRMETSVVESLCPGGLAAIQNLLLGRVNILGSGQLDSEDADEIEIYNADDTSWMLLPNQDIETAPYVYFFTLGKTDLDLQRFAVLAQNGMGDVNCLYSWSKKNMTIDFSAIFNGKSLGATLQLNSPDKGPKRLDRFEPSSKYKETDIRGLMK